MNERCSNVVADVVEWLRQTVSEEEARVAVLACRSLAGMLGWREEQEEEEAPHVTQESVSFSRNISRF